MSILTIHPKDEAQEKALKAIFDAFSVKYEKELDETEYLMASEAIKKRWIKVYSNLMQERV
jgi:hypothetical protein